MAQVTRVVGKQLCSLPAVIMVLTEGSVDWRIKSTVRLSSKFMLSGIVVCHIIHAESSLDRVLNKPVQLPSRKHILMRTLTVPLRLPLPCVVLSFPVRLALQHIHDIFANDGQELPAME
jgi:hypothetical protein